MKEIDLHSLIFPAMTAMGYKKANETNRTLRMPEIMIISTLVRYTNVPGFDIDLGIVFNPSSNPIAWKKVRHRHVRFNITLYNLLLKSGEPAEQLDKLFFFDSNNITATESELKNNLAVIMDLFKKKVIPYFENWNDYSWLIENFKKEIFRKHFDVYEDPGNYIGFFKQHATNVQLA